MILTDKERQDLFEQNAGYARDNFEAVIRATEAAVLAKLREQEPVMVYRGRCTVDCGEHGHHDVELLKMIQAGSKLYAAPLPAVVPQGWKLVPVEPTERMLAEVAVARRQWTNDKGHEAKVTYHIMLAAAPEAPAQGIPTKLPIPPAGADALDVVYAEGWNAACDAFFGGKPAPEPTVITVEAQALPAQGSTWMQRNAVFVITEAYEAGFGKGMQAAKRGEEVQNPWGDEPCREAWGLGYKEGKERYRPEAQAIPAPWREAVKVMRGALCIAAMYRLHENDSEDIDAAIALADRLEGGE